MMSKLDRMILLKGFLRRCLTLTLTVVPAFTAMSDQLRERGAARSASNGASSSSRAPSQEVPTELEAPWCMSLEEIDNSPSRAYFSKKYGADKAKSREQECRLATCVFLQESGQRLRL